MAESAKRPVAVLLMTSLRKLGDFILKAKDIVAKIGDNPDMFPTPDPSLTQIQANITLLEKAEVEVGKRTVGSVAARNQRYTQVLNDLRSLLGYVQDLADDKTDEQEAITIITSSGFSLRKTGIRLKPELQVVNSGISGKVLLSAKAAGSRVSYNWQQSDDPGISWADLPPTLQSKTSLSGLVPGQRLYCRVRAVTKQGPENWSQPVYLIVT